jgi:hypothetical protein
VEQSGFELLAPIRVCQATAECSVISLWVACQKLGRPGVKRSELKNKNGLYHADARTENIAQRKRIER